MTSQDNKKEEHLEFLEECRKLSMKEGFHGPVDPVHFPQGAHLSLEDRLALAIMTNPPSKIERMLKNGADLNYQLPNGTTLYHLAEIHRPELKDMMDKYHVEAPTERPRRKNKTGL